MICSDLVDNVCQGFFTLLLIAGIRFFFEFLGLLDKVPKIVADVTRTVCEERNETLVVLMTSMMRFVMTWQLRVWHSEEGDAERRLRLRDLSNGMRGHTSWMDR